MAAEPPPRFIESTRWTELLEEGRLLAGFFFRDADTLDLSVGEDFKNQEATCQSIQTAWWTRRGRKWEASIATGSAGTTLQTISKALQFLTVGHVDPETSKCFGVRNIDANVLPYGRNIPVDLTYEWDSVRRRYETIFNISDGVIALTGIETDQEPGGLLEDIYSKRYSSINDRDLSVVLGAVFFRLHKQWYPHIDAEKTARRLAKEKVMTSIDCGTPLPAVSKTALSSWLPYVLHNETTISQEVIEFEMHAWLNYVIVHVDDKQETSSVIHEVLRHVPIDNVATMTWAKRQVYVIGSWQYYALLGSNLGTSVAWLLLRHKDPVKLLGSKAVKSCFMPIVHRN